MKIRLLCRVFAEFPTLIYHLVEQKASEKTLQNVQHKKDSSSLIFSIDILFLENNQKLHPLQVGMARFEPGTLIM